MHDVKTYHIHALFTTDDYRIPIYQRNYAWGRSEISQLLQDILDYVPEKRNYYIGTLVVYPQQRNDNSKFYDTIDGQQRLTTLSILLSVLRNEYKKVTWYTKNILQFESRPLSQNALNFAFNGYFDGRVEYHVAIQEAYDHIVEDLPTKLSETKVELDDFINFLSNYVTLLRVEVPFDTDLNHYFEIMNNRGEQLEKHEVVKSHLLDALYDEQDENNAHLQQLFNKVWDAAQQMDRYVQFGFEPQLRKRLFGNDWSYLKVADSKELLDEFNQFVKLGDDRPTFLLTVDQILASDTNYSAAQASTENADRFTSPINFQNFLLHILKIQTEKSSVTLDDKKLIDLFRVELRGRNKEDKRAFVTEFMFNLLRGRWLLDTYVIKRQFVANKEGWSLLTLKSGDGTKGYYVNTFGKGEDDDGWDNETTVMLLSMFHVSTPTLNYKYWMNAALYYLMGTDDVDCDDYINYLTKIAKQLICFRFLNTEKVDKLDYQRLIYNNESLIEVYPEISYDDPKLRYGAIENNLLFNFVDYMIWFGSGDSDVANFEFSFRSSIEHYYPQNPIGGRKIAEGALHSFGNLCLISHQKNSKLNHHLPSAKKNYYVKLSGSGRLAYDSLKQRMMMIDYDADEWNEEDIKQHNEQIIDMLNNFIQNN